MNEVCQYCHQDILWQNSWWTAEDGEPDCFGAGSAGGHAPKPAPVEDNMALEVWLG